MGSSPANSMKTPQIRGFLFLTDTRSTWMKSGAALARESALVSTAIAKTQAATPEVTRSESHTPPGPHEPRPQAGRTREIGSRAAR